MAIDKPAIGVDDKLWPPVPYKGFSFYGPQDIPIFAGRDGEIIKFAEFVGNSETRLVLLQGETGCGKSSFLRAGVIPFLEGARRGFEFRKIRTDDQRSKALFIRSSDRPLLRLAEEIFRFANEGYEFVSPVGNETIELVGVLGGYKTAEDLGIAFHDRPQLLVEILREISTEIPSKLVLVIDQGEEVLPHGIEETVAQSSYFRFLSLFALSDFPLKLIVSLRTDTFGMFLNCVSRWKVGSPQLEQYLLRNLELPGLVAAIVRPTLPIEQGNYPPPPYGFRFEDSLPETIATDLIEKTREGGLLGGELPVLQVVCETLYTRTRGRSRPWTITKADYDALGHIEIQLSDYVDRYLVEFCKGKGLSSHRMMLEISHWKDALGGLVRMRPNNALTTDVKTFEDISARLDVSSRPLFGELLEYLSRDDVGVLRAELVKQLKATKAVRTFSLRHDAVGLVLKRWSEAREATKVFPFISKSTGLVYLLLGLVTSPLAAYSLYKEYSPEAFPVIIAGLFSALLGFALVIWSSRDSGSIHSQIFAYEAWLVVARVWLVRPAFAPPLLSLEQNPIFRLLLQTDERARLRFEALQRKYQSTRAA